MIERFCQACGCLEPYHSRGFCLKHYQALWRAEARMDPAERERVKEARKHERTDVNALWEFVQKELGING